MKIILSPAKKMHIKDDILDSVGQPVFLDKAKKLMNYMKSLSYEEAKEIWKCNDKIAALNYERFANMNLESRLTPAIFSYEGIQYQYMAPEVFDQSQLDYVQEHLLILSGFYGILSPMDGIVPYRLEMQAKLSPNLYHYWGDALYQHLVYRDRVVLNLASKEYSKVIEPYLESDVRFITCIFGVMEHEKVKVKATEAKMARGEMVRYLAEYGVTEPEGAKGFHRLGYQFQESLSDEITYVFIKEETEKRIGEKDS